MFLSLKRFVRGVSSHWVGALGVALVNASFFTFLLVEALRITGVVRSAYVGMVSYMALPAVFVLGLLLVPLGTWLLLRRTGGSWRDLASENFGEDWVAGRPLGSRLFVVVAGLTALNIAFLGGGSAKMLHFMEEPEFCGTACHSVMHPEYTAWADSPHARVRCVDCHVGEGTAALIDSKINGSWQLISVTFDLFERPIPTPVHQLRPARETCEKCHWPDAVYGDRVEVRPRYAMDEATTPSYTTLMLKVGSGRGQGIHWHVHPDNEVRYDSLHDERERMAWVEVRRADGTWHRYEDARLSAREAAEEHARTMDCVDCHNRATHIYEDPEDVVDALLADGSIDRRIPWARAVSLDALTTKWVDDDQAQRGISRELHHSTEAHDARLATTLAPELDAAADALYAAWSRNVHPLMKVGWGSYPDHLGHDGRRDGCFRCHHEDMVDEQGAAVPFQCDLCHDILAWDSETPFDLLSEPEEEDPEAELHVAARAALGMAVPPPPEPELRIPHPDDPPEE